MPSVRRRFVSAKSRAICRVFSGPIAVSSWTITSGCALPTASATCSGSRASATTGTRAELEEHPHAVDLMARSY